MARHRRKKKGLRKNPRRVAAAKRAYKKSGLHAYNLRRKKRKGHGKRKKGYGKRRKSHSRKKSHSRRKKSYGRYSGSAIAARARFNTLVKKLEAKGHDHKTAVALAHRASRIVTHMKAGAAKAKAEEREKAQQLSNLFGGIGAAGQLAALQK